MKCEKLVLIVILLCACVFGEGLPKVHYSYTMDNKVYDDVKAVTEYARITHALCINGYMATEELIDTVSGICREVNKTANIPCRIGIVYNPYNSAFEKGLPPEDRSESYYKELIQYTEKLSTIKGWLPDDVFVGAVILNCERFWTNREDNNAIRENLDAISYRSKLVFPDARVEWYGWGIKDTGSGWAKNRIFTGDEKIESFSASLYILPEIEGMLETYRRTAEFAAERGVESVTPWVSLAAGYKRTLEKPFVYDFDWDCPLIYSWLFGSYINSNSDKEWLAPFSKAKVVIFYPSPFDSRVTCWDKHFKAYVNGALGIKSLD